MAIQFIFYTVLIDNAVATVAVQPTSVVEFPFALLLRVERSLAGTNAKDT